jgi:NitT/TauT family transport system ATP-binding protein
VALGLRLRGVPKAEAESEAESWLARLGIAGFGGRYPRQLSGGQRKRVALAQVLALRPKLLLMDEPFASLDAIVRHRVTQDLLRWVEGSGIAVLLVTHDLEEAQALSDTVHLLSRGPRARIRDRYEVPIPRPRDLIAARGHPAFAPLLKRIWQDLSDEVDVHGGGI